MADSAIGITLGLALGSSWMSSMGKAMNEIGAFGRSLQSLKQMQIALPYVGDDKIDEAKRQVDELNAKVSSLKGNRQGGVFQIAVGLAAIRRWGGKLAKARAREYRESLAVMRKSADGVGG
ncbi:MAG: hypothetical protein LBS59_09340 [Puniceicoccales bacterium]|jgi:hypothetical protein|nr:hypothetical protein [Puniceicoccales bacterium]